MLNSAQLSRIHLNLLVLFSVVLKERHVARAAGRLNLTPYRRQSWARATATACSTTRCS